MIWVTLNGIALVQGVFPYNCCMPCDGLSSQQQSWAQR